MLGLVAALFLLYILRPGSAGHDATERQAQAFNTLTLFVAVLCWLSVLIGTYVIFPSYRATPPEGTLDLARYPLPGHSSWPTQAAPGCIASPWK